MKPSILQFLLDHRENVIFYHRVRKICEFPQVYAVFMILVKLFEVLVKVFFRRGYVLHLEVPDYQAFELIPLHPVIMILVCIVKELFEFLEVGVPRSLVRRFRADALVELEFFPQRIVIEIEKSSFQHYTLKMILIISYSIS